MAIAQDQFDKRRLERATDAYRSLFGDSELAVFVLAEGIVDCNPAACRLLGYRREELIGRSPLEFAPAEQPDGTASPAAARERVASAVAGLPQSFQWRFQDRNGAPVDTLLHLEAVRLDGATRLLLRARNLSRLWHAEENLRETQARLEQILDNANALVFAKDRDGRYLFANRRFQCLLRKREDEILGRADADLFGPEMARHYRASDLEVLDAGEARQFEETAQLLDGTHTYVSLKFPLLGGRGEPYAVCCIATDITDRKRVEDALRDAALAVSTAEGGAVFRELARYLAAILDVDVTFIASFGHERAAMRTLALWVDGELRDNIDYDLEGTPCQLVVGREFHFFPDRVTELFPSDNMFVRMGVRSYAAFPLNDAEGRALGLVAVVSRRPLANRPFIESVLKIFAARAAAEVERQRTDDARRRSEASYRSIFEASEDAIFIHDWDTGAIVDVNPRACRLYGYSRDELLRLRVGDLSSGDPPYTEAEAIRWIEKAKQGGRVQVEWRRRNKDGSLHWDEVILCKADIAGKPHILAITREITERKDAEERLRASEEQYRAMFEASVDGMLLWDSEHCIVDVNEAFLSMHGYHRDELIGQSQPVFVPSDLREKCATMLPEIVAGSPCHIEARHRRKDGSEFDVEIHGVPMRYQGRPHALFILRDISQRKRHEEELRASEEQYRAIFNASEDALILWNASLRRVDVNPAHERVFGWAPEEAIGGGFKERGVPDEYAERRYDLVRRSLAGEACYAEMDSLRRNGERFHAEVRTIPIQYRGEPHVLAIIRDITERKRAEEERGKLESQLRQAQKMEAIGQLTGGIAHDFNNILTSVMGYIALAADRSGGLGDERIERYLGQARASAVRARDLIQQMLTFSRGQRGEPRPIRLAPLVAESVTLLRSSLPTTIDIATDLDGGAPAVMLDPVQLDQVLLNLCINARDAMGGGGRITVSVGAESFAGGVCTACRSRLDGRFVALTVRDTGHGIGPEVVDRMFEPFFSTKEVGKGSGMGLSTVHGIVHEHGGHVVVISAPGEGAEFRVLFPALAGAETGLAATGPDTALDPPRQPALKGRVLLAEDEPTVAEFMRELLESWGLDVTVCGTGDAARDRFADDPEAFDLVLTDQTMPGLTGLELAKVLSRLRPKLPVILYTGYGEDLAEEKLRAAGVTSLVKKPVDAAQLLALLQTSLPARRPAL